MGSRRWWMLLRSSCHIWGATGQCTGTNLLPGFHQWHTRACELQMLAICRWQHYIERWNPMLNVINSSKTLIDYMYIDNTLGDVIQPLKVRHNASHQKKETHTQRLYHQRPNPEYCWHSHLPRGRTIVRPHLEQTSGTLAEIPHLIWTKSWSPTNGLV